MNSACRQFQRRLERALVGRNAPGELDAIAWHDHLLFCAPCRAMLEAEQVLEELLASLPEPRLSPAAKSRVVGRLRSARHEEAALDELLELDVTEPPNHLSRRVLHSLRSEREATAAGHLDQLLEAWDVGATPIGLEQRVLRGLASERVVQRPRRAPLWRIGIASAAAALLAWFGAQYLGSGETAPDPGLEVAVGSESELEEPSDELLANLSMLESWDVLTNDELDYLLASYDTADEYLLEWEEEDDDWSSEDSTEDPKQG